MMRASFLATVVAALALAGCSDIEVTTVQDEHTDFTKIHTWAWLDSLNNDAPDPQLSELARRRIKNCIQSELEARGYSWGPADKADMIVKWVAVASGSVELAPVGFRFGIDDPKTRGPVQGPSTIGEGSLVIDVMNNQAPRKVIWRGTALATVNRDLPDEERQERIQRAVAKTFESFPAHPAK
jgi:hypothetical protein